jgi:hypothetical protein
LANPYLPLVAKSAARYGVPADLLAALIHQESGFQPGVSSGAGAEGIAQFMPGTWSGSWNPFRSQSPFNAQAAIPAAALYLSRALQTNHGNVSLALASYNAGQGAVNRYHGVPPYSETQNYVRTILSGRGQFPGLANGTIPSNAPVAPNARQSTSMAFPETPQASALTTLPNPAYQATVSLQDLIQSNAQNAGIPSLRLPLPASTITQPIAPPPTVTTARPQGALPAPTTTTSAPSRGTLDSRSIYTRANLGRTDQGVDFTGTGTIPALADGVVTRVVPRGGPSGWPGGGFIVYRITSGPNAGRHVFVAENITPQVKVGQQIRYGQPIAIAHGGSPWTESGWAADASGTTLARSTTGYHEGEQTPAGKSFLAFLRSLRMI